VIPSEVIIKPCAPVIWLEKSSTVF